MKKFGQYISAIIAYAAYPLTILILGGSHRSRVVIYSNSGKILTIKTWLGQNKWGLPGGGIKKNESPGQGACREVLEEVGIELQAKELNYINNIEYKHHGLKLQLSIFTVHLDDQPPPKASWHEISEAKWLSPAQLNKQNACYDLLLCLKSLLQ